MRRRLPRPRASVEIEREHTRASRRVIIPHFLPPDGRRGLLPEMPMRGTIAVPNGVDRSCGLPQLRFSAKVVYGLRGELGRWRQRQHREKAAAWRPSFLPALSSLSRCMAAGRSSRIYSVLNGLATPHPSPYSVAHLVLTYLPNLPLALLHCHSPPAQAHRAQKMAAAVVRRAEELVAKKMNMRLYFFFVSLVFDCSR